MSTGSMSMKGSEGGPSPTSTNPSSPSTSISSTEKFSAAPPWIVHQLLVSAVRWELPLSIMFRFNASRELPSLKESKKYWLDDEQGRILTKFFSSLEKAPSVPQDGQASQTLSLDLLKRSLRVDTNSALGQQGIPTSIDSAESPNGSNQAPKDTDAKADLSGMPLTVAKRMLLIHTFRENYDSANFDQALTAIDYLRDLEYSRRMKLRKAAENLGINEHDWKSTLKDDPDALAWIQEVEKGELEIEQLFASLYVDMRIWTMLQQLKTTPFDKTSALAMLNTLFPPGVRDLPNDRIIPKFMEQQRNTFFQYISVLEKSNSGAQVAKEFEKKLLSSENRHNYQSVRWRLREYINLAETMATTADCVYGIGFFRGAEDGARAVSRAETASPIRPAKDGLLSKKSLGNIRHRFTMVRQRKAPESEPNTPAEESEPVPKIGEIEVDESAVIARVKAFSRPTTFIRPMSQAALSEAFNTLRTLIVPPFIEGLPPVTTDTISAPIPEPLNIKKKERKVEESVEAMDIKLEESIEQQQSPKLKRKRSVFGLKKKYSDPVSEEIMPSLPIAETEKKERSIFGLKKKPTEPASEEIVSSLPIPGPEKKEKGLFGMKKKRTDPLSEDIISSLPILESDKKERSLFGLKKKSTDSTPKEPPQPLPISEADKGKKEKYSLRGMRSLSSFKFRRQLDSRSTTPFTTGSKPSTPDTMEIIPAFPLPTRFSQDIRNFSRPRTATNDSSPQNPSLIARPATADGGSPPLPKRSPGKLRRQGTLLPLAPDDEFKSYFDTDEPAVLRKKSLKGARRGLLRRPASNHR